VGSGQHDEFRAGLRKLLGIVIAIGILGVIAGYLVGPTAGEILFGDKFTLGARDLALLAAGSGLFILALTLAQALIAVMGHSRATYAWIVGNIAFWVIAIATAQDLFLRVELGFVAGSGIAALAMALFLAARIRGGIPEQALVNFVEQIEHEQLEI
jgi:O-antigen/teichoic acid export membrane protein